MAQSDDFSWSDQRLIAVKRVDAVAVYRNADGDLVIRQEDPMGQPDRMVIIPSQYAYTVVEAMQAQLKGHPFGAPRSLAPTDAP